MSCGSSKEIRRLKKASKKLDKLVQKYPELDKQDTIKGVVIYESPKIVIDTIIEFDTDTLYLDSGTVIVTVLPPKNLEYRKEGVILKLQRVDSGKNWRYKLTAEIEPDTIAVPYEVILKVIQPAKIIEAPLTDFQRFLKGSGIALWIIIIIILLVLIIRIVKPF